MYICLGVKHTFHFNNLLGLPGRSSPDKPAAGIEFRLVRFRKTKSGCPPLLAELHEFRWILMRDGDRIIEGFGTENQQTMRLVGIASSSAVPFCFSVSSLRMFDNHETASGICLAWRQNISCGP